MSNILKAVVKADVSGFNAEMNSMGSTAKSAASLVVTAFAAATGALVAFGVAAKNATQRAEDQQISLIGIFRDVEKGTAVFNKLQKIADKSALSTDDLNNSFIRLSNNIESDQIDGWLDSIENIGFAARKAKIPAEEVAQVIGEIVSKFDLKKAETGTGGIDLDAWQRLSKVIGKDGVVALRALNVETLSTTQLSRALQKELKKTADVVKGPVEESLGGLEAKLGGVFDAALRDSGGQDAYKDLLKTLINVVEEVIESGQLQELGSALADVTTELTAIAKEEGTLLFFSDLLKAMILVANAIEKVLKGFRALGVLRSTYQNANAAGTKDISKNILDASRKFGVSSAVQKQIWNELLGGATGEGPINGKARSQLLKATKAGLNTDKGKAQYVKVLDENGIILDTKTQNAFNKMAIE